MSAKVSILDGMTKKEVDAYKEKHKDNPASKELKEKASKRHNIVSYDKLSPEARQFNARMGGIACGAKKHNSIILSETMKMLLELPLADEDVIRTTLIKKGIDSEIITEATAICYTQLQRAKMDSKGFEVVRDTIGQKPVERQEILANVESGTDILRNHFPDEFDEE